MWLSCKQANDEQRKKASKQTEITKKKSKFEVYRLQRHQKVAKQHFFGLEERPTARPRQGQDNKDNEKLTEDPKKNELHKAIVKGKPFPGDEQGAPGSKARIGAAGGSASTAASALAPTLPIPGDTGSTCSGDLRTSTTLLELFGEISMLFQNNETALF